MTEYGIWSDEADGFIETAFWSRREAQHWLAAIGEPVEDYRIRKICPDHEEEPADECEGCLS